MAADIYLEHATSANSDSTNCFGTSSSDANLLDWPSDFEYSMYFTEAHGPGNVEVYSAPFHTEEDVERTTVDQLSEEMRKLDFIAHDKLEPSKVVREMADRDLGGEMRSSNHNE